MPNKLGHVLIIPDGNRRWAKEKGLSYEEVYKIAAEKTTPLIINYFLVEGRASELTFFMAARNNLLKRDIVTEVMPILEAQKRLYVLLLRDERIKAAKIRFRFIGDKTLLPEDYVSALNNLERETSGRSGPLCNFLAGYDGEWEIKEAFTHGILKKGSEINQSIIPYLQLNTPIDLVIRSGFEKRLSGCPLLQMAHSELFFEKFHYPEFSKEKLDKIYGEYQKRERRLGQ